MANLTQLRTLENLHGFLCVDKPQGIAFSSVVKAVKRRFNLVKVGHGGSLDTMASGLLVLLVNDANRYTAEVMGADREWSGTMRLGLTTRTHDIYGEKLAETPAGGIDAARLDALRPEFLGDVFQTECRWCSVRREGAAGYETVDTGEHRPFLAHVYRWNFTSAPAADEADRVRVDFALSGTKGLIVRTLVADFGAALGCGAALEKLRRLRTGVFSVDEAVPFNRLLETAPAALPELVLPLSRLHL